MIDIIICNRQEKEVGVCHSHDYCDANMLMLEVFEENNLNVEDEANHQLWNDVWDLAKQNEFFYKMSEEKAKEYSLSSRPAKLLMSMTITQLFVRLWLFSFPTLNIPIIPTRPLPKF